MEGSTRPPPVNPSWASKRDSPNAACAVLVGCNYAGTPGIKRQLDGAVTDTLTLRNMIEVAWPRAEVSVLDDAGVSSEKPTKKTLVEKLLSFKFSSKMSVWSFSGHGSLTTRTRSPFFTTSDHAQLSDRDLHELVERVPENHVLLVIADFCHAASILRLPWTATFAGRWIRHKENTFRGKGVCVCISGSQHFGLAYDKGKEGGHFTIALNTVTNGGDELRKMPLVQLVERINAELSKSKEPQRAVLSSSHYLHRDSTLDSLCGRSEVVKLTPSHTHTLPRAHTHTHIHKHTHIHVHTHTHAQPPSWLERIFNYRNWR